MMNRINLFLVLLIGVTTSTVAQSIDGINFEDLMGDYIMLKVNSYKSGKTTKYFINHGDNGRGLSNKTIVRDDSGNEVESLSSVSILNFLTANGFELISFSTDREGSHMGYIYLMKNTKKNPFEIGQ